MSQNPLLHVSKPLENEESTGLAPRSFGGGALAMAQYDTGVAFTDADYAHAEADTPKPQSKPDMLATAYSFARQSKDADIMARSVEATLGTDMDALFAKDFPHLVEERKAVQHLDFAALTKEAEVTANALRQYGLMWGGASHIKELTQAEKSLRLLHVRKPGEQAPEGLNALEALFGGGYMGMLDLGNTTSRLGTELLDFINSNAAVEMYQGQGRSLEEAQNIVQGIQANIAKERAAHAEAPSAWQLDWEQKRGNSGFGVGLLADVARALPNMAATTAAFGLSGPVGAGLVGGSLIYGQSLNEYDKDPLATDPERNREAAFMNALFQAPLESLAIGKIFKAFTPSSSLFKALKIWGTGAVAEGGTEYLQSYPETFAREYARGLNPLERKDLGKLWDIFSGAEFQGGAAYQGLVGMVLGGGVGAVGIGANKKRFAQQAVNIANSLDMAKKLPEHFSLILKSHVQNNNVQKEIFMPVAKIEGLFQAESITQDKLDFLAAAGIDKADYESALATGADVAIPFENIHKVLAKDTAEGTLFQAIKMTPQQEEALEQSGGQTKALDVITAPPSPEEELALQNIMKGSPLDPHAAERMQYRQQVVDDLIAATKKTDTPYTAAEANAYADIIDARAVTWGKIFNQSPVEWYKRWQPEMVGGVLTEQDMQEARERAKTPQKHSLFTSEDLWQQDKSNSIVGTITEDVAALLPTKTAGNITLTDIGLQHIEKNHGKQIRDAGFDDAKSFVTYVMQHADAIYQEKGNRDFSLVVRQEKPYKLAIIKLEYSENNIYRVKTAFPVRDTKFTKKTPLWERAPSNQLQEQPPSAVSGQSGVLSESTVPTAESTVNTLKQSYDENFIPRASITFEQDARPIIRFFQAANITSAGHEIGHLLRRDLEAAATHKDAPDWLKKDWEAVNNFVEAKVGEKWSTEQEEQFAEAWTNWLDTGTAPSKKLLRPFRKLRQWFVQLYKSVTRQGVNPSPAMQKVFSRMLALESEIADAKTGAAITPMMYPENAPESFKQTYAKTLQNAEAATATVMENKLQKELRSERVKWKKDAAIFADNDFRQKRLDGLVEKGGITLTPEMQERYGKKAIAAIRNKRVGKKLLVSDGSQGVDAEIIADEWGFTGEGAVDTLFDYLENIPSKTALQDAYMAQMTVQWEQSWQADEIVLTHEFATMLDTEAQIIADAVGATAADGASLRKAVARNLALMEMGKLENQIESLKETHRQRGEEAREKFTARLQKRDDETIEIFTRKENLLRDALTREALQAKEQQRRTLEELKARYAIKEQRAKLERKIRRMARIKDDKVDYAYAEQFRALALRFGLATPSQGPRTPKSMPTLQAFITSLQDDYGVDIPVPEWLLASGQKNQSYKKLNIGQFEELATFMSWLEHQARDRKALKDGIKKIQLKQAVDELVTSMSSLKSKAAIADFERKSVSFKGAQNFGRELLAEITNIPWALNAADGFKTGMNFLDGPHDRLILQPLYAARSEELGLLSTKQRELEAVLLPFRHSKEKGKRWAMPNVPLPKNVQREWGAKPWTYERILMVALNMGNGGNKNALLKGFGWTEAHLAEITSTLQASDWAMVQKIWDLVDSLYPNINGAYEKVNGIPMKKVEAERLETPFGVMRGGYFPLVFDQALSGRAAEMQEEDMFANHQSAMFMKASPASGFTKDRKGGTLPPRLSLSVLSQHMIQSVHYATHAEAINHVSRIIKDKDFAESFIDKFGQPMYDQLNPWLRHMARPEQQMLTRFEKVVEFSRHMATIQALGLKFTTSALQLTSFSASAQEIGGKAMAEGLSFLATHRGKAIEDIKTLSPMMEARARNIDRDLAANLNKYDPDRKTFSWSYGDNTYEVGRKEMEEAVFAPMQFADSIVSFSTWYGGYQKAMRETGGDQKKAIAFANRAVIRAQAAGHPIDMTAMQRGAGIKKLMTMFMTYTMNLQNKARFYARGVGEGRIGVGEYTRHIFNDFVLPTVATTAMMGLLKSGEIPDEPEDYAKDLGFYFISGYPVLRDVSSAIDYGMLPGFTNDLVNRGISDPFRAAMGVYKLFFNDQKRGDDWEKFLKATMDAAGFWAGIPSRPVWQFIDGARDLYAGETKNPLRLFVKYEKPKED